MIEDYRGPLDFHLENKKLEPNQFAVHLAQTDPYGQPEQLWLYRTAKFADGEHSPYDAKGKAHKPFAVALARDMGRDPTEIFPLEFAEKTAVGYGIYWETLKEKLCTETYPTTDIEPEPPEPETTEAATREPEPEPLQPSEPEPPETNPVPNPGPGINDQAHELNGSVVSADPSLSGIAGAAFDEVTKPSSSNVRMYVITDEIKRIAELIMEMRKVQSEQRRFSEAALEAAANGKDSSEPLADIGYAQTSLKPLIAAFAALNPPIRTIQQVYFMLAAGRDDADGLTSKSRSQRTIEQFFGGYLRSVYYSNGAVVISQLARALAGMAKIKSAVAYKTLIDYEISRALQMGRGKIPEPKR